MVIENRKVIEAHPPHRRPFFLWVLLVGLLSFSLFNGLRVYGALHTWAYWKLMGLTPDPLYFAISGGIFALAFLAAAVMLFFQLRGAFWMVRVAVILYALWYWIDRLVFTHSGNEITNWPFAACVTVVFAGFSLAAVEATRTVYSK